MAPHELADEAGALGFTLSDAALVSLAGYLDNLIRWNSVINLIGMSDWRRAFRSLIVDSLYLARFLEQADLPAALEPQCWDLGAGAGLPGIPLRMLWQRGEYWLVESREKRALFLRTALARYPLPRTHVFHGRAEVFMDGSRRADIVISRAFMPWEKLLAFVKPHLNPDARVILLLNAPVALPENIPWKEAGRFSYPVEGTERMFLSLAHA